MLDVACHIEAESGNISRATLKVNQPLLTSWLSSVYHTLRTLLQIVSS